ncbi:MAG: hypothetical protein OES46_17535 [Gammaproteobacteria bacterium]|jgi:hypothetical protein|nr:hypothetical protein [Gammaproteobacteria bacterium]
MSSFLQTIRAEAAECLTPSPGVGGAEVAPIIAVGRRLANRRLAISALPGGGICSGGGLESDRVIAEIRNLLEG